MARSAILTESLFGQANVPVAISDLASSSLLLLLERQDMIINSLVTVLPARTMTVRSASHAFARSTDVALAFVLPTDHRTESTDGFLGHAEFEGGTERGGIAVGVLYEKKTERNWVREVDRTRSDWARSRTCLHSTHLPRSLRVEIRCQVNPPSEVLESRILPFPAPAFAVAVDKSTSRVQG